MNTDNLPSPAVTYTKTFLVCPHCAHHTNSSIDHLEAGRHFGPWFCDECGGSFLGVANGADTVLTKHHERQTKTLDLLVLEPTEKPIYFILDGIQFGEDGNKEYLYEEHSCPTNWLRNIRLVSVDGDIDPHGFMEFVRHVPAGTMPDDPNDEDETLCKLFPEVTKPCNLPDADEPALAKAEQLTEAWLQYKAQGKTVESYELKCLLLVYAELKALRERQPKLLLDAMAELDQLRAALTASTAQYQSACDDAHRFAAELEALRSKEPPHCHTCSCAPGSWGAKDIGIEFLFKWMYARNPMLGNMKPIDMMLLGRGDKVAKFIMEAMLDSMPPGSAPAKPCPDCGAVHAPGQNPLCNA